MSRGLPSIPSVEGITDPGMRAILRAMKAALDQLSGNSGTFGERAIRMNDLRECGIIEFVGNNGITCPEWLMDDPAAFNTTDYATPVAPDGLASTVSGNTVTLTWDRPLNRSMLRTEIWQLSADAFSEALTYAVGALVTYSSVVYKCTTAVVIAGAWTAGANWTAALAADLTVSRATLLDAVLGNRYTAAIPFGATLYFWVRFVTAENVAGAFNDTVGVDAQSVFNSQVIPSGSLFYHAGPTIPSGYLNCNGAAISRTTYATLFSAIGTTWGAGNGTTTFNVPDLRGRTGIGVGTGTGLTARALADLVGTETHALSSGELASHAHSYEDGKNTYTLNTGTQEVQSGTGVTVLSSASLSAPSASDTSRTTGSSGSGTAHNNMQPSAAIYWIIKT